MGISAVHEVIEFTGAMTMGLGDGFLLWGSGDTGSFDTEWDLINGFFGAFLGSGSYYLYMLRQRKYKQAVE